MNRKIVAVACLLIILVLVAVVAYLIWSSPPSTSLSVEPQTVQGTAGQNFTINVSISNVADLYGFEFKLGWNASLLEEVSVSEGPFLNMSDNNPFFSYSLNTTDEHVVVVCTREGEVPGVNGNGTLATIQFQVIQNGTCDLNLYDTQLLDSNDTAINHTVHIGHFNS